LDRRTANRALVNWAASLTTDFVHPRPKSTVDVSIELTKPVPKPARIVGTRFGCATTLPSEDLPGPIAPGQTRTYTLKIHAFSEASAGEARTPLYVHTTASGQAEVEFTLVGRWNSENQ
jgi:hypothetical protein